MKRVLRADFDVFILFQSTKIIFCRDALAIEEIRLVPMLC